MDQYTRRIIGFGIHRGIVDGSALCRRFKQAIRGAENLPASPETTRRNPIGPHQERTAEAEPRIQLPSLCPLRPANPPATGRSAHLRAPQRTIRSASDRASGLWPSIRTGSHRAHLPRHLGRSPTEPNDFVSEPPPKCWKPSECRRAESSIDDW
jgi:hypothetical protein